MRPHPVLLRNAPSNVIPVSKKYTLQSYGIWERFRRIFAIDPNRSTGVPINAQFRFPTPGSLPPQSYDDPVTLPAGDIADNPYWKRDGRRNYAQQSIVKQSDIVGLLTVGSEAAPKENILKIGDAGSQQLVEIKQAGEERGLAAFLEGNKQGVTAVFDAQGLPPMPPSVNATDIAPPRYEILPESGYPSKYPCRNFT